MSGGRNVGATVWCTRSVSIALQVPGRCTFALKLMASAMARSAFSSTYVWHTPLSCLITGIVDSLMMNCMSSSPPRGMMRSISLSCLSSRVETWRSELSMNVIAPAGMPSFSPASLSTFTIAALDWMASEPARGGEVFFVGLQQFRLAGFQGVGHGEERLVLHGRGQGRQLPCGSLGPGGFLDDVVGESHRITKLSR